MTATVLAVISSPPGDPLSPCRPGHIASDMSTSVIEAFSTAAISRVRAAKAGCWRRVGDDLLSCCALRHDPSLVDPSQSPVTRATCSIVAIGAGCIPLCFARLTRWRSPDPYGCQLWAVRPTTGRDIVRMRRWTPCRIGRR